MINMAIIYVGIFLMVIGAIIVALLRHWIGAVIFAVGLAITLFPILQEILANMPKTQLIFPILNRI